MADLSRLDQMSDDMFHSFTKLIHQSTGIKIEEDRKLMLISRLRKRLLALNLDSYDAYFHVVSLDNEEKEVFVESITTNETYCYRTPRIWRYLLENYLPQWLVKNKGNTLHAWSAASSSGEEAYTLGAILQNIKDQGEQFHYQILGKDISRRMIQRSVEGKYNERSLAKFKEVHPLICSRYFKRDAEKYTVDFKIREHIRFKQHNLFHFLNEPCLFDVILLRNVLIYFTPSDQEKVIELIHKKISPDGILIIGESESLNHINTNFELLEALIYKDKINVKSQ